MKGLYDVAVLGGGPAGIAAALAAARNGARTILIERYGFLGGMSTIAMVYPWMTFHTATGDQVIKGIAQEIVDRLMERNASPGHLRDTVGFVHTLTPYHPEQYKLLVFEMLEEAGAELMLHCLLTGAEVKDGRIQAVRLSHKAGEIRLRAKVFVDATGDGDLSYLSGASWELGNDQEQVQPMTMKFRMKGVDLAQVKQYMLDHPEEFYEKTPIEELKDLPLTGVSGFYSLWRRANVPIPRDGVLFFTGPDEDEVVVNVSRISGLNPLNAKDLTKAEVEGRKQAYLLEAFFREWIPGFSNAYITQIGTQVGIRETRRIIGEYVLNGQDVLNGNRFPDVIARSGYPIDIHDPEGSGVTANFIREGGAYDIPYRSIIPRGLENALLAGRCISTTHEAQATTRLTPSCMAIGQAAGTAASIAAKDQVDVRDVEIAKLQAALIAGGAELGLN